MTCTIPDGFETFIREEVDSGRYSSREELVAAALLLLQELKGRHDSLRSDVEASIAQADAGVLESLDTAATKAEGRRRLALEG